MKISVIHNLYLRNEYAAESARLNVKALNDANIQDYEYIIFNDNGDRLIETDLAEFLNSSDNRVKYIYSDINYGQRMCMGGTVGTLQHITGNIIHNNGQDDVMTPLFYRELKQCFEDDNNWYYTANGFKVDVQLKLKEIMIDINYQMRCDDPLLLFKIWFGILPPSYEVTRANNGFLAPGTAYRLELHNLIGNWDIDNFRGASDFEYWARILFNGYKGKYSSLPNWYYRMSPYSAGNVIIDGKPNRGYWQQQNIEMIKQKYTQLVNQNKDKFK